MTATKKYIYNVNINCTQAQMKEIIKKLQEVVGLDGYGVEIE